MLNDRLSACFVGFWEEEVYVNGFVATKQNEITIWKI